MFQSHCGCLGTLAIFFTPLCQCLSEETLKAVGPFYLMSKSKRSHTGGGGGGVNVSPLMDSILYLVNNVYMLLIKHKYIPIYLWFVIPRGERNAFGSVCLFVCLYVRRRNSKAIAPIDLIFVHKKYNPRDPALL